MNECSRLVIASSIVTLDSDKDRDIAYGVTDVKPFTDYH